MQDRPTRGVASSFDVFVDSYDSRLQISVFAVCPQRDRPLYPCVAPWLALRIFSFPVCEWSGGSGGKEEKER